VAGDVQHELQVFWGGLLSEGQTSSGGVVEYNCLWGEGGHLLDYFRFGFGCDESDRIVVSVVLDGPFLFLEEVAIHELQFGGVLRLQFGGTLANLKAFGGVRSLHGDRFIYNGWDG
jgi:hypothetical protein